MYSTDLVEAFALEQQREVRERAASAHRAHAAVAAHALPAEPRRPRRSWHPLLALHGWFAAGQL